MDRLRLKAEGGFTLIELLVVIAIIGILAAIAIPQFAAYRRRGFDSDTKSNVRNMATAQEAYFVDKSTYTSAVSDLTPRGYKQSTNVGAAAPAGAATTFIASATAVNGCLASTGIWTFSSSTGLLTGTPCS
jgi:prepilin-type N-terminal cleavage/methylation domain-containing protein